MDQLKFSVLKASYLANAYVEIVIVHTAADQTHTVELGGLVCIC